MIKSGFGSKGFVKSSVQNIGQRTLAQTYGSVRSALVSIIPYTTNLAVWTTLTPSLISSTTSGSSSVIDSWLDAVNAYPVSQTITASMPTPSTLYGINKFIGVRFISDDYLFNNSVDASNSSFMTYGVHLRANTDYGTLSRIFTAPHSQATMSPPSLETFYAFNFYDEGGALKRHYLGYSINVGGVGNRGSSQQPFVGIANLKYYADDYIYYFSIGTDSSRNFIMRVSDKNGAAIQTYTIPYATFLGVDNTTAWDATFGGPAGPTIPKMRPVIGRLASDAVYYTQLKFGSSALPTAEELQKITRYLESAYGKTMAQ